MKHTPLNTPYKIRQDKDYLFRFIIENNNGVDIGAIELDSVAKGKAIVKHIVHAVNMHEYLVESLKSAIMVLESKKINCDLLRQTLSQAERK